MMIRMKKILFWTVTFLFISLSQSNAVKPQDPVVDKEKIRIVITDSGLGGLSVMDDIAKKMEGSGYYKTAELIFVNALFNAERGYNALSSREEKILQLNLVLSGIETKFHPDIILIACNTLSVIFKETEFIKKSDTPVVGIVIPGVDLIAGRLSKDDNSAVIITGTITTISENNHKESLLRKGFQSDRIITQACPELQSYIEKDPYGEDTGMLISVYIEEALARLPEYADNIYLSLNCSHFGYSEKLWQQAFYDAGADLREILNPNYTISNGLFPDRNRNRFGKTEISQVVYSKVVIKNKGSMYVFFIDKSPELAKALNNYILEEDLF